MAQKLNVQYTVINFSASGNTTVIPADTVPTGSNMRPSFINIWELALVMGGATNITFQDGTGPMSGPLPMLANGAIALESTTTPHFIVSPTNGFVINSSNAVQVSGWVIWSV